MLLFILLPIYFNLTNYGCCTDAFLGKASFFYFADILAYKKAGIMYPLHLRVDGFTQLTNATGRFYTTKAKGVDGSTQLEATTGTLVDN